MNPASGVHKNSTGPAISRALATRPRGIAGGNLLAQLGVGQRGCRHIRRHPPRRHTVYPNPLGASSLDRLFVRLISAPFVTA